MAYHHLSFKPSYSSFSNPLTKPYPSNVPTIGAQFAVPKCNLNRPSSSSSTDVESNQKDKLKKLEIGSPIIVVEAPQLLKTATSVPCLRANNNLVKPGDVGRIVSRKPKDVWAVRLSIGTYLIDGKYFKALEIDE